MGSERPAAPPPPVDDLAERAARVRVMLIRWAAEVVTDEPDWTFEDIEPMHFADDESNKKRK